MIDAYPLSWPTGYPRTESRERSRFKVTHGAAVHGLIRELKLLGCPDWNVIISTNLPLRRDGLPYAGMKPANGDTGAAVYFCLGSGDKERRMVLACDRWDRVEDNIHAIEMTVGAMRGMDRWGCSDMLNRAFTGFTALPAPEDKTFWWQVLECAANADAEIVERRYRELAFKCHPDHGGSVESMAKLNRAVAEARART